MISRYQAPSVAHQGASGSPLEEPSAQMRSSRGCQGLRPLRPRRAPACSAVSAGATAPASRHPRVSTRTTLFCTQMRRQTTR
jgi:hypothetical protein